MNPYGKLPQEQAMQTLIHETNRVISELGFHITKLSDWMREHHREQCKPAGIEVSSTPYIHIEYLKSKRDDLRKAIDVYVTDFKNDFQENTRN
jgi:membrane protease subunit (stomatin/prohibitin family)